MLNEWAGQGDDAQADNETKRPDGTWTSSPGAGNINPARYEDPALKKEPNSWKTGIGA